MQRMRWPHGVLLFRDWLVRQERPLRGLVVLVGIVIFMVQWVRASMLVTDGDFNLHWKFARRLLEHELLYAEGLHVPYPPSWAIAWLPIAFLPLTAAKIVCYPLSACGIAIVLWVLDRLCRDRLPVTTSARFWAAAAALVIVSRFLVRELPECGPNLMLLACVWSGIYLWQRQRDCAAGACLGLATALKCTPGLFIAYFAWKRQWKLVISAIVATAVVGLAPALWQGPKDYQLHIQIWIANLRYGLEQADPSAGVLGPDTLQNLSLRPALVRWLMHLPAGHPGRLDVPAFIEPLDLPPAAAGVVAKAVLLSLLFGLACLFRKPIADRDGAAVAWECAAVGALSLLLSPITWYQHCVALLPVFYLFARTFAAGIRPARWMLSVLAGFVVIVVVLNRGLIGRDATLLLASYHLTTLAIVGAFVLAVGNRLQLSKTTRQGDKETSGTRDLLRVAASACPHVTPLLEWAKRANWTMSFVAIGLALRLYHYLRNPSLWHDEAALVINVLDKSFTELLGALTFSEAAPPLFLWLEKTAVLLFGESLFVLRLLPLATSCAALALFVPVARRLLGSAAPWAVLLFAVSDRLLWHACEAKQYSLELFVAVLMLFVWLRTEACSVRRRACLFALLAPPLLTLAYPAAFLYGGLMLALLRQVWPSRKHSDWLACGFLCLMVFATFGLLLAGPIHAQRDTTIVTCWETMKQFPDWNSPGSVPGWLAGSSCDVVGYCAKPIGEWLTPLVALGLQVLWRQGRRDWCLLLVVPVLLALGAACVKAYPYGGMRVMTYAAPAVFLLAAAAVPWCRERLVGRHTWAAAVVAALWLVPVARAGYCVVRPWERADCAAAAAYVQAHRQGADLVTANHWEFLYYFRRLGRDFVPIEDLASPRQRTWVVVTGAVPADRAPTLALFSDAQWSTLDRQEFPRTTVVLLERRHKDPNYLTQGHRQLQ